MDKIKLDVLMEFVSHPGFQLYNDMINVKIEYYENELKNKNTDWERTQVIRNAILDLEEIQNEPIAALEMAKYELQDSEDTSNMEAIHNKKDEVMKKIRRRRKVK